MTHRNGSLWNQDRLRRLLNSRHLEGHRELRGAEGLAKARLRIITTELEEMTDHTLAEVM